MTTVDMAAYWPNPPQGQQLMVQDCSVAWGAEAMTVLRRYRRIGAVNGQPLIQLDEYTSGGWLSAWEYRHDPTHGVIETANRFPGVRMAYKPGKWIIWGGQMTVGQNIQQGIEVDLPASTGVVSAPGNYGWQSVTFEALHPTFTSGSGAAYSDVVQIRVLQSWCKNWTCAFPAGQNVFEIRYWLAPAVGIVQVEYIAPDARTDFARHVFNTAAMVGGA